MTTILTVSGIRHPFPPDLERQVKAKADPSFTWDQDQTCEGK
jgi:hypothetical protein